MKIDMQEIERIGGRAKNPDIDAALRILEMNGLVVEERPRVDRGDDHRTVNTPTSFFNSSR